MGKLGADMEMTQEEINQWIPAEPNWEKEFTKWVFKHKHEKQELPVTLQRVLAINGTRAFKLEFDNLPVAGYSLEVLANEADHTAKDWQPYVVRWRQTLPLSRYFTIHLAPKERTLFGWVHKFYRMDGLKKLDITDDPLVNFLNDWWDGKSFQKGQKYFNNCFQAPPGWSGQYKVTEIMTPMKIQPNAQGATVLEAVAFLPIKPRSAKIDMDVNRTGFLPFYLLGTNLDQFVQTNRGALEAQFDTTHK